MSDQTTIQTTARNATLADLANLLRVQHDAKLDAIVPAQAIHSEDGVLAIEGVRPKMPDNVEALLAVADRPPLGERGRFAPTEIADGHLAEKLGIPTAYLRRMRAERLDLFDANVNGWLLGGIPHEWPWMPVGSEKADPRRFMARCFLDPNGGVGVCRAILSDSYKRIDNLDVLTAALDGVRQSGQEVEVLDADLSEKRMTVRLVAPGVEALAPTLLRGYRDPFQGDPARQAAAEAHGWLRPDDRPTVFAGFVLSNSETGGGAFTIVPRLMVKVCRNGLVVTKDAVRNVHLGGKLDEGVVRWSDATQARNLELVASQTRDAVTTFLDVDYMRLVLDGIEERAGAVLTEPAKQVEVIANRMKYPQGVLDGLLDHFIRGGQTTTGGVLQAVTSVAQTIADPDLAWQIESSALEAFEMACTVARS
jgi:hypothetical protein